jgi:hypothetical protein
MLVQFDILHDPCRSLTRQKRSSLASTVLVLASTTILGACTRQSPPSVPLPPELAAIHCPADRNEHARTLIGKAEVTFVCVDRTQAVDPSLMRCDRETPPNLCEDAGEILLSHDADGLVYAGPPPNYSAERDNAGPTSGPTDDSQLIVNFHAGPPRTRTFDPVETPYRFLLPGAQDMLPDGFTFVKGMPCDRVATVLNTGTCNLEATTPSLYWHISISIHHKQGTPIYDREYRTELALWMKYLGLMIVDPKQ